MARRISTRGPREPSIGALHLLFAKSTAFPRCRRPRPRMHSMQRFRGIQRAICGRHRAVLPHVSNRIGTIALHIKGKAGVRNPQTGNQHHARQNDDRIGRTRDCLGRNNDEWCIRSTKTHSTKKGQGNNTKGGVRDAIRGHSELGAANRASVRTSWSPRPSHPQTAPASKQMTRWGPKPIAGVWPAERIAAMCPTNSRRRLPTGKFV